VHRLPVEWRTQQAEPPGAAVLVVRYVARVTSVVRFMAVVAAMVLVGPAGPT
jgi:hypothetical protein